ncbi:MAG: hypothetical protein FD169_421 [Bacillota bacterium]|nr:MAG: hypothetical protein FD169_421 [Bacillota bacterium]
MKINLLPQELQQRPRRSKTTLIILLSIICAVVPLALYSLNLVTTVETLSSQRNALEARATKLLPLDGLLRERAALEQELRRIEGEPIPGQTRLLVYLDELARLMPDSLFISDLSLDETRFTVRGVTPTYALSAEFLKLLAGSEVFSAPTLSFLNSETGGHGFEITVQIRAVTAP